MRHLVPACRALLWCLALASAASLAAAGPEGPAAEFSPGRIGCLIYTGDISNPYQVASFFVLPGERVELGLSGVHRERHRLEVNGGDDRGRRDRNGSGRRRRSPACTMGSSTTRTPLTSPG